MNVLCVLKLYVSVLVLAAVACRHGWWGKLLAEWCPLCVWVWAVPLGAGQEAWANLWVDKEKTQRLWNKRTLLSQFHVIPPQTDAGSGLQRPLAQWCEKLYLNLCSGYLLTSSKLCFFLLCIVPPQSPALHIDHRHWLATLKYWLSCRLLKTGLSRLLYNQGQKHHTKL